LEIKFLKIAKVRMAISSKGKGKRAGARVISYVLVQDTTVFLLTIYDKSEKENIDNSEILELIHSIGF
jgi:mRNA-degrading endonuclease RelE of RelBE toxin-antitoxin system